MPAAFNKCVKGGGRVRTITGPNKRFGLKGDEFVRICFPRGGGASVRGEKKVRVTKKAMEG